MSAHAYRRVETVTHGKVAATIYYALSGKSARVEVWEAEAVGAARRLHTVRCAPERAQEKARGLVAFWAAQPGNHQTEPQP